MRVLLVLGVIGHLLRLFSLAFIAPIVLALADRDYAVALYFAVALLATLLTGQILVRGYRPVRLFRRAEAMGVVAGVWLVIGHFAALPYIFCGLAPVDALFESISGFTTTGATILRDFSLGESAEGPTLTRAFFLWRAMTQWFGGLGVIALFVVVLPRLGIAGRQLFFAEASDAASEGIAPQIRETARRLWVLYTVLTAIEVLALILAGMTPYFAVVHSLTTLAAGGFSPNSLSFGGYQNPAAEWIVVVFMLLAGTSFTLQWRGFTGKPTAFLRDGEFLFYIGSILIGTLLLGYLLAGGVPSLDQLRAGAFQATSLISSTGFASTDYDLWTDGAKGVLIALMVIGGCAGSAAGGPKALRLLLVLKFLGSEITRFLHPRAVLPVRYGRRIIPAEILHAVFTLWVLYLVGYLIVGLLLVLLGEDLVTGFSAALACLGNIGPGFSVVGPMGNYADLPVLSKMILTIAMWVGRLEIVAVLALLHPHVWKSLQFSRVKKNLTKTTYD